MKNNVRNIIKPGPKPILDEFTNLPVSRQRKKQLRNIKNGLCMICSKKIYKSYRCKKHYYKHLIYARERARELKEILI